jgi:hypothetical protein
LSDKTVDVRGREHGVKRSQQDIVARLRSDSTAALAASLILAGSFPDIVSWALRAFGGKSDPGCIVTVGQRASSGAKYRLAIEPPNLRTGGRQRHARPCRNGLLAQSHNLAMTGNEPEGGVPGRSG